MLSSRNLSSLPEIDEIRGHLQAMAALDAALAAQLGDSQPDYWFDPVWAKHEQMAAYKNGSGDEVFMHFTPQGCFIKGFAHESLMTPYRVDPPELWPGMLDGIPEQFAASVSEPAFDIDSTTFVVWRLHSDAAWQSTKVAFPEQQGDCDGSAELLGLLTLSGLAFTEWLEDNYEVDLDEELVKATLRGEPLTPERLAALCPAGQLRSLVAAVSQTGFPLNS